MRIDETGAPPSSDMVLLVESASTRSGAAGNLNGYFRAWPDRHTDTSKFRPFNYNNTIVRSYVDGSALGVGPRRSGNVAGREFHLNNFDLAPVHRAELGWNPQKSTPVSTWQGSPYAGNWTFTSHNDGWHHKPWFTRWRSKWYKGFRP